MLLRVNHESVEAGQARIGDNLLDQATAQAAAAVFRKDREALQLRVGALIQPYGAPPRGGDLRAVELSDHVATRGFVLVPLQLGRAPLLVHEHLRDRKSTRLNSSHVTISYAVF